MIREFLENNAAGFATDVGDYKAPLNITEAELGTIMENNTASVGVLKMFADPEYKIFRVYCKDLRAEAEII